MKRPTDRIFTISNALSLSRIILALPLVWALEVDNMQAVVIMIVLAVLSDFFDGYMARKAHEITNVGKMLDPIADKFIMMAVMIFLIFDPERHFPIYFFLLLALRDITNSIIVTYLMNIRVEVYQSNPTGKWFLSVTALAMVFYMLRFPEIGFWVLLIATLLLLISWYFYLRRYADYFKTLPES
ncbi:MAG: CDP-alcohol phosphatidyltransferase family protein [Fidelibacterota bacterium]|nr:MAG: CDP-alcohol phosphatidyltransferase family protein [Candidatus Neomarinimicrobiota bacterium]